MAFDRARIEAFLALSEGETPPVFVGRAPILDDILAVAESGWGGGAAASQGKPKATRIVQGAPGAGKSTILAELARRAAGGRTQVLALGAGIIRGPIDILRPLAERIDPEAARTFLARDQTTHRMGGQLGALGSSVGADRTTTTTPPAPEPTLVAFRDWVRDLEAAGGGLTGPIIIAIDETQNLEGPHTTPLAKVLQSIHNTDLPLPLTLVLAGLGDTDARATDMGLTRGKTLHNIGALAAEEVAELTHRWCGHFGLDPTGHADSLAALARPCEGWPRHLHFALQALGRDLLRSPDADPAALAAVDWARVATEAAISRLHHYQSQQRGALAGCAALVGAVLDDLRPFHRRTDVIDLIERHDGTRPGRAWQVPKGMDIDSLTDHLLHRGALQETPDGALTCPIPSFRSHLVRDGIRMELGTDPIGPGDVPTAGETARILAACEPHTEDEIIHWQALAARWDRHCAALAAVAADAAALATVTDSPTDADRTRATRVLATLDGEGGTAGPDSPALPRSLPHATRAAEALAGMVDAVRTASAAIRDGEADPWRADTFADVATVPDLAATASPEEQLAWALEHLTGAAPETPEASGPAPDASPLPAP